MLDVLYEDNHLLAINKPAMLPTMGVAENTPSLLALAKEYIRRKYDKPGNVYLGIVSRLDAPVTGVVVMARTSKAAGRLTNQFKERGVQKIYWAVVAGQVAPTSACLTNFLRRDERHRRVHVTGPDAQGAQMAELSYRSLVTDPLAPQLRARSDASLLEVRLHTGRKHQIRVQLAHAGHPVVGDRKYGSDRPFSIGIALHARKLVLEHPVRKILVEVEAPLPQSWQGLLRREG